MANYKKQYDKMRRTRLEKACITMQIAVGIGFLLTGALQTTLLTHTNPYTMVKYQFCFMAAYFAFIGIAIACAVIRTVEHGKRKAFDLTHRASSEYRRQAYIAAQYQKEQADRWQRNTPLENQYAGAAGNTDRISGETVKAIDKKVILEDYFPEIHNS